MKLVWSLHTRSEWHEAGNLLFDKFTDNNLCTWSYLISRRALNDEHILFLFWANISEKNTARIGLNAFIRFSPQFLAFTFVLCRYCESFLRKDVCQQEPVLLAKLLSRQLSPTNRCWLDPTNPMVLLSTVGNLEMYKSHVSVFCTYVHILRSDLCKGTTTFRCHGNCFCKYKPCSDNCT